MAVENKEALAGMRDRYLREKNRQRISFRTPARKIMISDVHEVPCVKDHTTIAEEVVSFDESAQVVIAAATKRMVSACGLD